MRRRAAAILAASLALSAPGVALGQSAGDEQYRDPFAGDEGGGSQGSGGGNTTSGGGSGGGSTGGAPTASTPVAPTAPTQVAGESTGAVPVQAGDTLPRTGRAAWALAAIGIALLCAGVSLRRTLSA